jgi:hypothetical protein
MPKGIDHISSFPKFYLDTKGYYPEATLFLITGEDLDALLCFLCSDIGFFIFTKFFAGPQFDATGFRYKKEYITCLPVPHSDFNYKKMKYDIWIKQKIGLSQEEVEYTQLYKKDLITQTASRKNVSLES